MSGSSGNNAVTEDLIYQYALRVAYLTSLTQPKAVPSAPESNVDPNYKRYSASKEKTSHLDQLHSSVTHGLYQLGEFLKEERKGRQRIPKELIKALQTRLKNIIDGRDPNPVFQDPYLKTEISLFYDALSRPAFQKQLKSNSKIEDLVLIYLQTAQIELKKASFEPPVTWQDKLTEHVGIFVELLEEALQSRECAGIANPELMARLNSYKNKFGAKSNKVANTNVTSSNTDDMAMVKMVQAMFNVSANQLQKDINAIKRQCTEQVGHFLMNIREWGLLVGCY